MGEQRIHTCMLCEATCGVSVDLENGRVVSVRGDPEDPFSRGHICPKAAAIPDVMDDPDRIREPMRRVGNRWEPVSWDEALAEAGERLAAIQRQHGRSAVGLYLGNPTVHSLGSSLFAALFVRGLGSRVRFSATSVDQLPQMLASLKMFGHVLLFTIPDVDRTDFFLMLGANPLASNGSLMTAPDIRGRLQALKKRGGKLVVVDPRRTETAAMADEHLSIRPGGDAAFLLGMLHVLFAEGLTRPGRLADFTKSLDKLSALAARFPPERVAARAGVPAETIRRLAREFAAAKTACSYGRVGMSTQEFGGTASWLCYALNIVTGNLDRPGGVMFTKPAADIVALRARTGDLGSFGRWKSRVRGLPEFDGELPAAAMAEEISTPGEGQLRGLVTYAGNPVLSTPNGAQLDRALSKLDYMVAIDLYRNETTRHANLILPTRFGFERDHYDLVFNVMAVRNVARYVPAIVAPPPGVRHDWEAMLDLALSVRAHGGGKPSKRLGLTLRAARMLGPTRALDLLLRTGPHRLSLAKLKAAPHGLDLSALEPCFPERLYTKDKRIELVPELYESDLPRVEKDVDAATSATGPTGARGELLLIGKRDLRSNNSWMHNSLRLVKGRPACVLLMHPRDAAERALADGASVRVRSRVGEVVVPLSVRDEVAPGVVCLPHGWGHAVEGSALGVAKAHAGVSLNDLTDEQRIDPLSGNANFSGTPVTVEAA